jgi:hypothetical protein
MRKLVLAVSAFALTAPVVAPAAAEAHRTGYRHAHPPVHQVECRKRSGTSGLIIGGAAGALGGRELDKGRNRATGTILGGAVGALLGRVAERELLSRKCR